MAKVAGRIGVRLAGVGLGYQRGRSGRLDDEFAQYLTEPLSAHSLFQITDTQQRGLVNIGVPGLRRRLDTLHEDRTHHH